MASYRTKVANTLRVFIDCSKSYELAPSLQQHGFTKGKSLESPERTQKLSAFARTLLTYWVENPRAKDTLDGIAGWWVRYQEFRFWRPLVQQALSELVDTELILENDGRYELNPEAQHTIRGLIGLDK
jgi:hypothetical protein